MEYASSPVEHPGTQTRKGTLSIPILHALRQNLVLEEFEGFGISKEAGDRNQHFLEQVTDRAYNHSMRFARHFIRQTPGVLNSYSQSTLMVFHPVAALRV